MISRCSKCHKYYGLATVWGRWLCTYCLAEYGIYIPAHYSPNKRTYPAKKQKKKKRPPQIADIKIEEIICDGNSPLTAK